jgi:hypothetical protein
MSNKIMEKFFPGAGMNEIFKNSEYPKKNDMVLNTCIAAGFVALAIYVVYEIKRKRMIDDEVNTE